MKVTTYNIPGNALAFQKLTETLGGEFVFPGEMNEKVFSVGVKNSPEFTCFPYKIFMSHFYEAARQGLDGAFIFGVNNMRSCRYEDYFKGIGEFIHKNGYPDFKLCFWGGKGMMYSLGEQLDIFGKRSFPVKVLAIRRAFLGFRIGDWLHEKANYLRPRAVETDQVETFYKKHFGLFQMAKTLGEMNKAWFEAKEEASIIKLKDGVKPMKIMLVGDVFTVLDDFATFDTMKVLADLGVECQPATYFGELLRGSNRLDFMDGELGFGERKRLASKYMKDNISAFADISLGSLVQARSRKFDGVIHFKTFSCMPEIAMGIIYKKVCKDLSLPFMEFVRDDHSSFEMYRTRLEAFVDTMQNSNYVRG